MSPNLVIRKSLGFFDKCRPKIRIITLVKTISQVEEVFSKNFMMQYIFVHFCSIYLAYLKKLRGARCGDRC